MKGMAIAVSVILMSAVMVQAEVVYQDSFEEYDPTWQFSCYPNWSGYNDYEPTLLMGPWSDAAEARTGDQFYRYACPAGAGFDLSEIITSTVPIRPEGAGDGIVTASMWAKIGSEDLDGETNVASRLGLFLYDSSLTLGTYFTILGDSGNTNRRVKYYDGSTFVSAPVEWPTDEYFNVKVSMNEIDNMWGFSLTAADGTNLVTISDIAQTGGIWGPLNGPIASVGLYIENNVTGDGFLNLIDDVTVEFSMPVTQLPGDANGDGAVNVGDLGILAGNYGTTSGATWEMGDFNGDGAVNVGDLGILAGNYGSSAAASVPEPLSLSLLTVGGLALLRRKR
jgi:hypothetical protein